MIERHRSESPGDSPSRGADGTFHRHHRGTIHHGTRETDWSPKDMFVVAE